MSVTIYIELLDGGTPVWRPTQGVELGRGEYLVLPTEKYDPDDEVWAFVPATRVVREKKLPGKGQVLVAMRLAEPE